MPNPSAATVTAGPILDFFGGAPAALTVEVIPVLGGTASHLVHAETGTAMAAYRRTFESDPDTGAVTFTLPHVDAPGWLDETGRTVTFWKYTARVTAVFDGDKTRRLSWRKEIQPLTGQSSIDLELVPNGQTAEQFVTPRVPVLSVNGETGVVEIPDLAGIGLKSTPSYKLTLNDTIRIPNSAVPGSTLIWVVANGDRTPGPLWAQIYRQGTYNGVWKFGGSESWTVGTTEEPTTGGFRIWVDGNGTAAELCLKATNNFGRLVRIYWLTI